MASGGGCFRSHLAYFYRHSHSSGAPRKLVTGVLRWFVHRIHFLGPVLRFASIGCCAPLPKAKPQRS
jgi:hypothetical protein